MLESPAIEDIVQIHVLYADHPEDPDSREDVRRMATEFYTWFRIPEQRWRGIPVRVWCSSTANKSGETEPIQAVSNLMAHIAKEPVANKIHYVVLLADSHMVSHAEWHRDILELIEADTFKKEEEGQPRAKLLPVAMDETAMNFPSAVAAMNFIWYRRDSLAPSQARRRVIKDVMEGIARHFNGCLFGEDKKSAQDEPIMVFISYARKDGPEIPRLLRDYIQGETQCDAFLDENDIGFGNDFKAVIRAKLGKDGIDKAGARGMIVVQGDHYADRPICRAEIQEFLKAGKVGAKGKLFMFHPMVVIDTLTGKQVTRVIPELGTVPKLRWREGSAEESFMLLLRDMLIGFRNTWMAKNDKIGKTFLKLNRLPGPLGLQEFIIEHPENSLVHYGLPPSKIEDRLYRCVKEGVKLTDGRSKDSTETEGALTLVGKFVGVRWQEQKDGGSSGWLPAHFIEAAIAILRPVVRAGASVMVFNLLPETESGGKEPIFHALIDLLNDERDISDLVGKRKKAEQPARLYSVLSKAQWEPAHLKRFQAEWMSVASFVDGGKKSVPELQEEAFRGIPCKLPHKSKQRKIIAACVIHVGLDSSSSHQWASSMPIHIAWPVSGTKSETIPKLIESASEVTNPPSVT